MRALLLLFVVILFAPAQAAACVLPARISAPLAIVLAATKTKLIVSSPLSEGLIPSPEKLSCPYRYVPLPEIRWSSAPRGTKSFAIIIQQVLLADAGSDAMVVRIMRDIPPSARSLPPYKRGPMDHPGRGMIEVPEYSLAAPPAGRLAYHVQVFALDAQLTNVAPYEKAALDFVQSHAIAKGELVVNYDPPYTPQ